MKTTYTPINEAELAGLRAAIADANPAPGDWMHAQMSGLIHAGKAVEAKGGFERLKGGMITGIRAEYDDCCDVTAHQYRTNLRLLLKAVNALPALLAEVAESRAEDKRLAEVLDVRLPKFAADLAEAAPVGLGEYSPALCVEAAITLVRAALNPPSGETTGGPADA
jgi:hypothetical protein